MSQPVLRARAAFAVAIMVFAVLALDASTAWAHNQVVDTAPGDTTTVEGPIAAVVIRVDHPPLEPLAQESVIKVTAPSGQIVSTGEVIADPPQRLVEPIPVLNQGDDGEWVQEYHFEAYPLRMAIGSLPEEGEYTVDYTLTDSDGHPAVGALTFTYTGPTGAVPADAPDPEAGPLLVTTVSAEEAAAADPEGAAGATDPVTIPDAEPDGDDAAAAQNTAADDRDAADPAVGDDGVPAVVITGLGVVAVLAVVAGAVWWRRRSDGTGSARSAPTQSPSRGSSRTRPATARRSPSAKRPR